MRIYAFKRSAIPCLETLADFLCPDLFVLGLLGRIEALQEELCEACPVIRRKGEKIIKNWLSYHHFLQKCGESATTASHPCQGFFLVYYAPDSQPCFKTSSDFLRLGRIPHISGPC